MLRNWGKIYTVGDPKIADLFDGPVEVTEKLDGSQFNFGMFNGKLHMRSKGAVIDVEKAAVQKLFAPVVDYVRSIVDHLPEGMSFHGETLASRRHNTLTYDRVPKNHLALYGAIYYGEKAEQKALGGDELKRWADVLEVDVVPSYGMHQIKTLEELQELVRESYLGGVTAEGIVLKNYAKPMILFGQEFPIMQGKYVTEKFKEKHKVNPLYINQNNFIAKVAEAYAVEARWEKSVQRMREEGELTGTVKDIGPLIGRVSKDIHEEDADIIKDLLFKHFWRQLASGMVRGVPQWYKDKIAAEALENNGKHEENENNP